MSTKMYQCFCGQWLSSLEFRRHVYHCKTYQEESKKCLTYDNFYQKYMVERIPYSKFFLDEPFCHCRPGDLLNLAKECNFPKIITVKSGKRMSVNEIDSILSKDFLYDCYINKNMSANEISSLLNNDFWSQTILEKLKFYGIEKRTIKQAMAVSDFRENQKLSMKRLDVRLKISKKANSKETREKYKKTCIQRFGCDNPSKSSIIKAKVNNTLYKHYKVRTLPQLLALKGINPTTKSYSNISIQLFKEICKRFPNYDSYFKYHNHNGEHIVSFIDHCYYLDFSIEIDNMKLDIEFNGDYWHCNPQLYCENYVVNTGSHKIIAKDIWHHDEIRKKELESKGYKILTVWEYDFRNEPERIINECCDFIKSNLLEHKLNVL